MKLDTGYWILKSSSNYPVSSIQFHASSFNLMDADEIKAVLQTCELFITLDNEELDILIQHGELKELPRGKILYMKGQKSDDTFCLLLEGGVNIVAKDGHVVKEIIGNEVIGEVALSNPHHMRTVTVITKDPSVILEWNVNHIKDGVPNLWKKLLKHAWKNITTYYEE